MKFGNYLISGKAMTMLSGVLVGGVCLFGLKGDENKNLKEVNLEQKFLTTSITEKETFLRNHFYESLRFKSEDIAERTSDAFNYFGRKLEKNEIPNYQKKQNYRSLERFFGGKNGTN